MNFDSSRKFILSIPRFRSKLVTTLEHLHDSGIDPEVFDGFDCEISGLKTRWTYEIDHPGSGYVTSEKHVNLCLGHYMIWKVMLYQPNDCILILEDDVRFKPGWRSDFDVGISHLPEDWDILFLGSCCMAGGIQNTVWGKLCKVPFALCTHAYVLRKKALPILIEKCQKIWAPIDLSMRFNALPFLNCYAFHPRLADQFQTNLPE